MASIKVTGDMLANARYRFLLIHQEIRRNITTGQLSVNTFPRKQQQ